MKHITLEKYKQMVTFSRIFILQLLKVFFDRKTVPQDLKI